MSVLPAPFDPALDDAEIELGTRLRLYRTMQEIRQLEKRLHDLFLQNLVKGTSHLATGMEATAAAFGVALRPGLTDVVYASNGGRDPSRPPDLAPYLEPCSIVRLAVLPSGVAPERPGELLGSPTMAAVLVLARLCEL